MTHSRSVPVFPTARRILGSVGTVSDVLRAANAEIGYAETPVNKTKFAAEAGHPNGYAWCATFVVAIMRRAGVKLPSESASTITMYGAMPHVPKPVAGDLAFFNFGAGPIHHVGIVETVGPYELVTIEGNTSAGAAGSQYNGGGVYRRTRATSLVVGYGRPQYTQPAIEVKPMYDPPLQIVAALECPTGGTWLLGRDGGIFAYGGAPFLGSAAGKPYFAGRVAAQLNPVNGQYQIVTTSGEKYGPGF